jgi:hypothetical protein
MFCRRRKSRQTQSAIPPRAKQGLLARVNRALTEVGVEHFDDDLDWDARVKLPEWQLARLKQRHAQRQRKVAARRRNPQAEPEQSGDSPGL